MLARADDGGLGTQTYEIVRHMKPDRVLIVDVIPRRGEFHPERYDELGVDYRVTSNPVRADALAWLLEDVDRLFTSETFYLDDALPVVQRARLLLLANPELFVPQYVYLADRGLITVFAPTEWERDRLGPHSLLPQPVARDRLPFRLRSGCARTFLHISSPAMLDRNGTQLVRAACEVYDGEPIEVWISGPTKPAETVRFRNVTVRPIPHAAEYCDRWTDAVDVFLQPRRYGGLSMVQSEAASSGIPTICLDRFPEQSWGGAITVPTTGQTRGRMKGGDIPVYDANASDVADAMAWSSTLVDITELSVAADAWAESIAWSTLLPEWEAALR